MPNKISPLSEKEFTQKYLHEAAKVYPEVSYEIISPLTIEATFGNSEQSLHYLGNAYATYQLDINDLDSVLDEFISALRELYIPKAELNINRIVPIIKPADYLDHLKSLGNGVDGYEIPDIVWETYNEDLIIVYAEDTERSIRYFDHDDLEKAGASKDSLLERSIANLSELVSEIETLGEKGSYMLIAGGAYEASLILIEAIWNNKDFAVDGEIIIGIPNRDVVFITGSNDIEAIKKMKDNTLKSYEKNSYSISKSIYKWNGTKFGKIE